MKTQLKKDEKIILQTQPHWFTLAGPALVAFITLILGFAIGSYVILIGVFGIGYFAYKYMERKNNLWVITNLRVIDEYGVFSNNSKESPLDKINNVSYNQTFWGRILGYGNVQIQTAAEIGSTTYYSVDNPKELKDTITRMQEEYKHLQIKMQAAELANAITEGQNYKFDVAFELEKLHELKQKGILTEEEFNTRKKKVLSS
jgi:uncharacterized membrane protein YdbT with pleckstrin-like domain